MYVHKIHHRLAIEVNLNHRVKEMKDRYFSDRNLRDCGQNNLVAFSCIQSEMILQGTTKPKFIFNQGAIL